ncbi:MAG: hypothetical protein IKO36_04805 [Bacteroidaceae bacterium]|nr:hypothetical protein [Bacteroidaceae bacterium]
MKHLITLIVGLLFASLLFSCKTQREIETVYVDRSRVIQDTILKWDIDTVLDSVVITKTDTLTMYEKYRTRIQQKTEYKIKYQTDTVIRTEYKTVTKTEYKNKPLKWWQLMLMTLGVFFILLLTWVIYNFKDLK